MNGKITVTLDKESLERLQRDADEWGVAIEEYARMVLVGKKPSFLELTPEQLKKLQDTMKLIYPQKT